MARNRKRAKERRSRRPDAGLSRPGVATARAGREQSGHDDSPRPVERAPSPDERTLGSDGHDETPSPLEHATPDVELANAQLALGRPAAADQPDFGEPDFGDGEGGDFDLDGGSDDGGGASGGGELTTGGSGSPASRGFPGNRLINFLQGSWRELQRVQWPDRRQVMQATGVVIGFVIVAGVFLGVADALAGKIVNYILK